MLVTKILQSKGTKGVLTIAPDVSIADAVSELAQRRIGALVVSADGSTADGILSERDVVRELARRGGEVLAGKVSTLMTRDVQTARPGDSAESVLERMTEGRFRHMPVMEDGTLVGLISLGDVVKARLSEVSMEKDALEAMVTGH
ncbi:CBS domain-containing protein [Jannaschia sp. W003]|uniref:CBS domain-containing protein n=1 Tax=Jannaschia sp. W003 TaxID=2867012 RepID=UPI0021A417D8|nr:CBS domain-containing protein [Jannaschia sp. W003]UWQ20318.1 CBS domain-containing protein [Jannaschia sp. W003]